MRIENNASDEALMRELGHRIARTRLERNITQADLARRARLGRRTLQRLESGDEVTLTSFVRVMRALDMLDALEAAVPEPTPSPLERLRLAGEAPRRAGRRKRKAAKGWQWSDEGPGGD